MLRSIPKQTGRTWGGGIIPGAESPSATATEQQMREQALFRLLPWDFPLACCNVGEPIKPLSSSHRDVQGTEMFLLRRV